VDDFGHVGHGLHDFGGGGGDVDEAVGGLAGEAGGEVEGGSEEMLAGGQGKIGIVAAAVADEGLEEAGTDGEVGVGI